MRVWSTATVRGASGAPSEANKTVKGSVAGNPFDTGVCSPLLGYSGNPGVNGEFHLTGVSAGCVAFDTRSDHRYRATPSIPTPIQ